MSPSIWQILIVVALIMLLFGAGKLPRIMGDMAEGIKSFKRGMKDEDDSTTPSEKSEKTPGPKDTLN